MSSNIDGSNATTQSFSLEDQKAFFINAIKSKNGMIDKYHLEMIQIANEQQLKQWILDFSMNKSIKEILGKIPNPKAEIFIKLLKEKFGDKVTEKYIKQINESHEEQILNWQQQFFLNKSLKNIFKEEIDYAYCFLLFLVIVVLMSLCYRFQTDPWRIAVGVMFWSIFAIPLGFGCMFVMKIAEEMCEK